MPKYRRKAGKIIDANVFQWGMEAGVIRYNSYIPRDGDSYSEGMRSEKHKGYLAKHDMDLDEKGFNEDEWKPYVVTIHGQKTIVAEGDVILPEPDGIHFYPCKPDIFADTYELVED